MELVERYIREVERNLPRKTGADISAEIRSVLEDMILDRAQELDREPDEELQGEVLQEYGPPDKVAATYLPDRYLIGPALYPIFVLVVKVVAAVMAGFFLISIAMGYFDSERTLADLGRVLVDMVPNLYTTLVTSLGSIVIVFAILDRMNLDVRTGIEPWNPRHLPKLEQESPERPYQLILRVLGLAAVLVMLNYFRPWIGALSVQDGQTTFVPMLSVGFETYLPWFNLRWAAGIIWALLMLRVRQRDGWVRWVDIGFKLSDFALMFAVIVGPSVVGLNPEYLAYHNLERSSLTLYTELLVPLVDGGLRLGLGIALLVSFIEGLKAFLERLGRRTPVMSTTR